MDYIYSVEEARDKIIGMLIESTGWKYLKSRNCLKKTVKDLIFEINFFAPVELLRLLFKKKLLNKDASVIFVSSIGGNGSYNFGNEFYKRLFKISIKESFKIFNISNL